MSTPPKKTWARVVVLIMAIAMLASFVFMVIR